MNNNENLLAFIADVCSELTERNEEAQKERAGAEYGLDPKDAEPRRRNQADPVLGREGNRKR